MDGIRKELRRRRLPVTAERGYVLNDHFTAYAVRHMIAHHPEWAPLFELRELGKRRHQRKVVVIQN